MPWRGGDQYRQSWMSSLDALEIGEGRCEFRGVGYTWRHLQDEPMIFVGIRTEPSAKNLKKTLIRMTVRVGIRSKMGQPFLQDPMR